MKISILRPMVNPKVLIPGKHAIAGSPHEWMMEEIQKRHFPDKKKSKKGKSIANNNKKQ